MSKISKICLLAIMMHNTIAYSAVALDKPIEIKEWIYKNPNKANWVKPETRFKSGDTLDSSIDEISNIVCDLKNNNTKLDIANSLVLTAANLNYLIVRAAVAVFMNNQLKTLEAALKESKTTVQNQIKSLKIENGAQLDDAISDGEKYISGTCIQELIPIIQKQKNTKNNDEYFVIDNSDEIIENESKKIKDIEKALHPDNLKDLNNNLDLIFNHEKEIDNDFKDINTEKIKAKNKYYEILSAEVPTALKGAMNSNDTQLVSSIINKLAHFNAQSEVITKLYENILNSGEGSETLLHYCARNESTKEFVSDIFELMKKVVGSKKDQLDKQKTLKNLLIAKSKFNIDGEDYDAIPFELAASWKTDIAAAILEETIELSTDLYKPGQNDIINEMAKIMQANCSTANELLGKISINKLQKTIILDPKNSIYNKLQRYINTYPELGKILKDNSFGQYVNIEGIERAFMSSVDIPLTIFGCREEDVKTGNLINYGYIQYPSTLLLKFESKEGVLKTITNPVTEKPLDWKTYFIIDGTIYNGETNAQMDLLFPKSSYGAAKPPFYDNDGSEIYTDGTNDYHEINVPRPAENPANPTIRKINKAVADYNNFANEFNKLVQQQK